MTREHVLMMVTDNVGTQWYRVNGSPAAIADLRDATTVPSRLSASDLARLARHQYPKATVIIMSMETAKEIAARHRD